MKKVFKVENVDCPVCAGRMEAEAAKVAGVEQVQINFVLQKMTLAAAEENFDAIVDQVEKACRRVDRDMEIVR